MQAELHDSLCRLAQLPHMYREPADQGNANEHVRQANKMEAKMEVEKVVQVISRALRRETKLNAPCEQDKKETKGGGKRKVDTERSQAMTEGVSVERNNDDTDTTSVGKSTGKLVCRVLVRRGGGSKVKCTKSGRMQCTRKSKWVQYEKCARNVLRGDVSVGDASIRSPA